MLSFAVATTFALSVAHVPALDASAESCLLGELRALACPRGELAHGTFVASNVVVADGFVRARLQGSAAVFVRATQFANGDIDNAYAFSVDGTGKLRVRRVDHGVDRDLGDVRIEGAMKKSTVLELVVVFVGPLLSASVYDGDTLAPRAHLELGDGRLQQGTVGARADDGVVSLLTVSNGKQASDANDGAMSERVVTLDAHDHVPPGARILERNDDEVVANVDALLLERMMRTGIVPHSVRAKIAFVDEDAQLRARLARNDPTPASTAAGFRVDESYKDATLVDGILRAYADKFPDVARVVPIGQTTLGRTINALEIGTHRGGDVDSVLLDGAHHGGELMSIELVLDAVQQLVEGYGHDPAMAALVDGLDIWCVPLVNVDGNMRFVHETIESTRKNVDGVDGVDLYRNYPVDWGGNGEVGSKSNPFHYKYRGPEPASEPENRAMMELAEKERFTSSIDYHTNATAILVPYTDPSMTSPDPNEAWSIARTMSDASGVQVNGKRYSVQRDLYPVDGVYQDWLRNRFGTVALLVEGPQHNPEPYATMRAKNVDGTRPTWRTLLERTLNGPGFVVHTHAADGKPIEAEVVVDEQKLKMNERWTTRPRDGRMHRLLPAGAYTIHVRADGYNDETRRIVVGEGNVNVDVTLRDLSR